MRWWLVLITACGRIDFSLLGTPTGDGGSADTIAGDVGAGCVDPGNGDTFGNGPACVGWGTQVSNMVTLTEINGELHVSPDANAALVTGSCRHDPVPFPAEGAMVEVGQIANTQTFFILDTAVATPPEFSITEAGGMVFPAATNESPPGQPYDPIAMRWWRMRPSAGHVEFETSPDGIVWSHLFTSLQGPPASTTIQLGASTLTADPTPGTAIFESVNTCP